MSPVIQLGVITRSSDSNSGGWDGCNSLLEIIDWTVAVWYGVGTDLDIGKVHQSKEIWIFSVRNQAHLLGAFRKRTFSAKVRYQELYWDSWKIYLLDCHMLKIAVRDILVRHPEFRKKWGSQLEDFHSEDCCDLTKRPEFRSWRGSPTGRLPPAPGCRPGSCASGRA